MKLGEDRHKSGNKDQAKLAIQDFSEAAWCFEHCRALTKKMEPEQVSEDLSDVTLMTLSYMNQAKA